MTERPAVDIGNKRTSREDRSADVDPPKERSDADTAKTSAVASDQVSDGNAEVVVLESADYPELEHSAGLVPTDPPSDGGGLKPQRWRGKFSMRVVSRRGLALGILPGIALVLTVGAGYLKWLDSSSQSDQGARFESIQAAKDGTVAMLSYQPDTVEQALTAASDRLIGEFRDSYTSLTRDVVIPGAREKRISATATVPAAASVSASASLAVVLVFVDQTVTVGSGIPSDTASSIRVTLTKVGDRWLVSKFEPV